MELSHDLQHLSSGAHVEVDAAAANTVRFWIIPGACDSLSVAQTGELEPNSIGNAPRFVSSSSPVSRCRRTCSGVCAGAGPGRDAAEGLVVSTDAQIPKPEAPHRAKRPAAQGQGTTRKPTYMHIAH